MCICLFSMREILIPGTHYCGPFTDLRKKLQPDGKTPKPQYKPTDRVDQAALRHDIFYGEHYSWLDRLQSDKRMIAEVKAIRNPTCKERFEQVIVILALSIKIFVTKCIFEITNNDDHES